MLGTVWDWLSEMRAYVERQAFVDRLMRLSDRDLNDIGLRRDQLDALRLAPLRSPRARRRSKSTRAVSPSLQGCG